MIAMSLHSNGWVQFAVVVIGLGCIFLWGYILDREMAHPPIRPNDQIIDTHQRHRSSLANRQAAARARTRGW